MKVWNILKDKFSFFNANDLPWLSDIYWTVLVLFAAYVIWFIFKKVLLSVEKKMDRLKISNLFSEIFPIIRQVVRLGIIMFAGFCLIRLYDAQMIEKVFIALMSICFAAPINRFVITMVKLLKEKVAVNTETKVDDIIFDLLIKFSGVIIYAVVIIISLDFMGVNVMPFVAGAGVLGVAIGFAAKDTLSNLIAGILLILDRPFEIGDRIEVWSAPKNSATWGDVIDIGIRATKIKTTDNIIIVIPNNEIMTRDIVNYTLISSAIRVRINLGVSYDSDIEIAKAAIVDVAGRADWILKKPVPMVVVHSFGESSINLQARVWIKDARKRIHTISFITDNIKHEFDKRGIEIPCPKRELTVKSITAEKNKLVPIEKAS